MTSSAAAFAEGPRPVDMFEAMRQTRLLVLFREDVASELKLTDSQKFTIQRTMASELPTNGQKPKNLPFFVTRSMMSKMIGDKVRGVEKKVLAVLDAKQKDRLDELWFQWRSYTISYRNDIRKLLKTESQQNDTIKKIESDYHDRRESLTFSQCLKLMPAEISALQNVFTAEQAKRIASYGGSPMKFSPEGKLFVNLGLES